MAESEVQASNVEATGQQSDVFAELLLKEFKPKTDKAREAVESEVRTLAEKALEQTTLISNDAIITIQ